MPYKTYHVGLLLEGRCFKNFQWEEKVAFL